MVDKSVKLAALGKQMSNFLKKKKDSKKASLDHACREGHIYDPSLHKCIPIVKKLT